jgi:hypothetical protein
MKLPIIKHHGGNNKKKQQMFIKHLLYAYYGAPGSRVHNLIVTSF